MPTEDEQIPEEPVWRSVLLFCCKGVIEGIIVLLFLWLLVQVLFTKQLEVHLQVLLTVGLVVLCLTLILGCVICWCRTTHAPPDNQKYVTSPPPPDSVDHMTLESSPAPSAGTTFTKLQYEELDGDVVDDPSASESSTPSAETFTSAVSEVKQKACFQMRRLSSPTISTSLYRPMASNRSSLPSFPRFSFLSKSRKGSHNYGSTSCNETLFLHFTLTFASMQNSLTVTFVDIIGKVHSLDNVTIQVRLPPLYPEPLNIPFQDQSSVFHEKNLVVNVGTLEDLKSCVLRLSIFSEDHPRTNLAQEVEVCCRGLDWIPDMPITCVKKLSCGPD